MTPDLFCTYDGCYISVGPSMQCSGGYWQARANGGLKCKIPSCDGGT